MKKSESQNDWNRTIFWGSNFADFWVWSVVLWFSYTNTHASVSPRIHCICIPLWYLFFREQYTFILQTSSDVIDLTGAFYQKILQHILNGNFVLNKGNYKGTFWAQVKYDKMYICVVLVYFLTLYMPIFEKFLLNDISVTL